jgi:DNA polymerase-3 subunit beta
METRVARKDLLAELTPMQGVVERKSTIPVLSHILLRAEDGTLHMAATDLDVSLTASCDADVIGDGAIAVQARKFIEIIRASAGEDVLLAQEEESRLRIEVGRSRFKINGLSAEDFPSLPEVPADGSVSIPYEKLRAMISKVIFAVSTEESRFQLNGALMKLADGTLSIVATDGYRLALVENDLEGATAGEGVLVPRKALQELQRLEGEGDVTFARGDHHLSFRVGRRELICRILEGSFPDYDRVIAKDNDKKVVIDRQRLNETVQRVALLTGERARAIRCEFGDDALKVSATNPDLGEATEELECSVEGGEVRIGINPDYLSNFLAAAETEEVRLELKDENTQCVGFPVGGEDRRYLCVVMPMRI